MDSKPKPCGVTSLRNVHCSQGKLLSRTSQISQIKCNWNNRDALEQTDLYINS